MAPSAIVGARERRHPVAVVPAVVGNLIPAAVGRRGTMPSLCALIGVFEISGRSLAGGGADAGWGRQGRRSAPGNDRSGCGAIRIASGLKRRGV